MRKIWGAAIAAMALACAAPAGATVFVVTYCMADITCTALGAGSSYASATDHFDAGPTRITFAYDTSVVTPISFSDDGPPASSSIGFQVDSADPSPLVYASIEMGGQTFKLRQTPLYLSHTRLNSDYFSGGDPGVPFSQISDTYQGIGSDGRGDYIRVGLNTQDPIPFDFGAVFQRDADATYDFDGETSGIAFTGGVSLGMSETGGTQDYDISFARVRVDLLAVPEPASWALLIGGFGAVGGVLRTSSRSRRRPA